MPAEPRPTAQAGIKELLRAIRRFAGPRLGRTIAVVALAAVLEGAGLVLLLPVAETVFASGEGTRSGVTAEIAQGLAAIGLDTVIEQLAAMGGAFLLLVGARALVLLHRDVLLMQLSQGFVDTIRRDFFIRLAHADWPVIKRFRKAELLNTMTTNIGRLAQAMRFLSSGMVTVAMGLAYLAAAFVLSTVLGLALLVLIAIGAASAVVWTRRSHRLGTRLNLANRSVMHETTRFLDGMKAAKAARAETQLSERFAMSIAETRAISVDFVTQQARLRNAVQLIAAIAALLVLLVGYAVLGLTGGELLVMAAIVMRLAPSLVTTFSGLQSIAHALPAFESIRGLEAELEAAHRPPDAERAQPGTMSIPPADEPLELADARVDVRNENGETMTLVRARELSIAPGMLVHVGGASGTGKSTLAELIAGLHLPAAGSVSRGACQLDPATRSGWQSRIAFAPQEPFLFDGTVRENLLWPNLEREDAGLWDALDRAEAAEIVRSLPAGLDEELLDGGARLSGGERQRLCIARALLRPADLLVLDEATSAMDPELERRIIGRLKREIGDRIVVMVSHSLNAVEHADLRIEVEAGEAIVRN